MSSTTFPISPLRITSLKTTFRLPSNDKRWTISPDTSPSEDEGASSRCYTRRIGWGSPKNSWEREMDLHLSGSHIFRLYRRMRIGAAQRDLSRNNGECFWHRATPVSFARSGFAATAILCSIREPIFGTRATMGCGGLENQCQHDKDGVYLVAVGRSGAD